MFYESMANQGELKLPPAGGGKLEPKAGCFLMGDAHTVKGQRGLVGAHSVGKLKTSASPWALC